MSVKFLNVDLDVGSQEPLDAFCRALKDAGIDELYHGPGDDGVFARFECSNGGETSDPEEIINRFCDVIESLDEVASNEWRAAGFRCFDLGYRVTGADTVRQFALETATLSRVVALGARLGFTIYPPCPDDEGIILPDGGTSFICRDT